MVEVVMVVQGKGKGKPIPVDALRVPGG